MKDLTVDEVFYISRDQRMFRYLKRLDECLDLIDSEKISDEKYLQKLNSLNQLARDLIQRELSPASMENVVSCLYRTNQLYKIINLSTKFTIRLKNLVIVIQSNFLHARNEGLTTIEEYRKMARS